MRGSAAKKIRKLAKIVMLREILLGREARPESPQQIDRTLKKLEKQLKRKWARLSNPKSLSGPELSARQVKKSLDSLLSPTPQPNSGTLQGQSA